MQIPAKNLTSMINAARVEVATAQTARHRAAQRSEGREMTSRRRPTWIQSPMSLRLPRLRVRPGGANRKKEDELEAQRVQHGELFADQMRPKPRREPLEERINKDKEEKAKASRQRENLMNLQIYEEQKEQFPLAINIIHLMSLAPNGLTAHDLRRILLLAEEGAYDN